MSNTPDTPLPVRKADTDACPCGSGAGYDACCGPIIRGSRPARTAEDLMRSRYSAYVKKEMAYLLTSLHRDFRSDYDEKSSRAWAERAEWKGIEIINTLRGGPDDDEGQVEFNVVFIENGIKQEHHELSSFKKENGVWFFTNGRVLLPRQVVHQAPKTGRNDPCPCGSGKKYKKCCGQ
ncbi:MAG TPA: YchJ family protein [Nitrospirota bacterium]|nr:YchJ family protein [Nitrospirota bacterium]